jgi:hypothetical protein
LKQKGSKNSRTGQMLRCPVRAHSQQAPKAGPDPSAPCSPQYYSLGLVHWLLSGLISKGLLCGETAGAVAPLISHLGAEGT